MDDFACESSIAGARVFHSSESKKSRIWWLFVYFLAFVLIGFYVFNIFTRYKVEPEFSYEFSQIPLQEIPFPAVTICSSLFSKNQVVNLKNVLKNPKIVNNYTRWQHTLLAANVQACNPELGPKIHKLVPLAEPHKTIKAIKRTHTNIDEATNFKTNWRKCLYNWAYTECSKIMNYVLTDFGFCFTFNLEGFATLFNTEIISDDFKCYRRDEISRNFYFGHSDYTKTIVDENQTIQWTLANGYTTESMHVLPARALYKRNFGFHGRINATDVSNLCPKRGKSYLLFYHMPNEILTPFHQPIIITQSYDFLLKFRLHKVNENLRPFPPEKRNCYFDGERKLKFFKSYTKAHCEFECLANITLAQCGCVKFSMPRENFTRICGLNETLCYIQVAKNWNLTCGCLQTCTYIVYDVHHKLPNVGFKEKHWVVSLRMFFDGIFGEKTEVSGIYGVFQSFADFGGMLGAIFGASLMSVIEIFYFLVLSLVKCNIRITKSKVDVSDFASSSTIHGVLFIFDKSRHKFVRFFWTFAFIFSFLCCIYNSRDSYSKLKVVPETESTENLKSADEIPFPAISLKSPIFSKGGLTPTSFHFLHRFYLNNSSIKELTSDQFHYLLANFLTSGSNVLQGIMRKRAQYSENITVDPLNYRFEMDFFPYLFQSHLEVDELFFNCKFQGKSIQCSKLFKKVMNFQGIFYTFNMQSHKEIFNEEISKNFDSYGKFEEKGLQWTLDQGYIENSTSQTLASASKHNTLEFGLKITVKDFQNKYYGLIATKLFVHLPNEILSHVMPSHYLYINTHNMVKLSAKTKRSEVKLRNFSPQNRGCYFQDEIKLQFFKKYTRSNCILECLTNFTLKSCDCVAFLLPHNNSTRTCGSAKEVNCYDGIWQQFPPYHDKLVPCGCLPTCNDIEYSLNFETKHFKVTSKGGKIPNQVMNIKFQFDSSKIIEEEIRVAFGVQDFLTNVGGFLGLYLGCSVISIFEIFYFIFLIFHKNLSKKKNENLTKLSHQNTGFTLVEIFN